MKKAISILLIFIIALGLISGCSSPTVTEEVIELGHTVEDANTYFFMDRQYALDASNVDTTEAELKKAEEYLTQYILEAAQSGNSAFDFKYGDVNFADTIKEWTLETEHTGDTETQTDWTLTYTKADMPITVTVYATLYKEYAIIEWTVWIENTGSENTEQITELYALNDTFAEGTESDIRLTTFEGGKESNNSFRAESNLLESGKKKSLGGTGGKSSVTWSPYINLQWTNEEAAWGKEGVFISTGWSGQWKNDIENTGAGVSVKASQERLNTYLQPGESIRSPLMTLLFWEKDFMRSQNLWRRWVYYVAMPQPDGEPIPSQTTSNTAQDTSLTETATTQNQVAAIEKWAELGITTDYWQMDAGWYDSANNSTDWVDTGSWEPSEERFNGSLKTVSDTLHENDMSLILWYEPERLVSNSDWHTQFKGTDYLIESTWGWHIFNLSSDEATDWLIDYMIANIDANGVDIYRQDCNLNDGNSLMTFWKRAEEENRIGYVENRYIINYLRYFDAILEHTGTYIDGCASGGKRLDLETTKRSVALWRDDKCYDALLTQCQSWGINFFMPYSGQGSLDQSTSTMLYTTRSNMMASTIYPWMLSAITDSNLDLHKQVIEEHNTYAYYFTQDYYPLTPFSELETDWMAWQYHDPTNSTGMVQVFKRIESTQDTDTYYLSGLETDTTYRVEDIDTGDYVELTGRQLMQYGIKVNIQTEFEAKIFYYEPIETAAE